MADLPHLPDQTDWLSTSVPQLSSVEAALRCQVCKNFFNTPMMTSCAHTFCSLCIRRCLTNDGRCPICRAQDQEMRLRSNWALQELVEAFEAARASIFELSERRDFVADSVLQTKRRRIESPGEELESAGQRRHRRGPTPSPVARNELGIEAALPQATQGDDCVKSATGAARLAACPICGKKMPEVDVFLHLDTHDDIEPTRARPVQAVQGKTRPSSAMERLPQINYSLLNDGALRKKMAGLGISSMGTRAILTQRYTEWVNIVNANCDAKVPRSKKELLDDLEVWDRSQQRHVLTSGSHVTTPLMSKDFDGEAWSKNHRLDFERLVLEARQRSRTKVRSDEPSTAHSEG